MAIDALILTSGDICAAFQRRAENPHLSPPSATPAKFLAVSLVKKIYF